MRTKILCFVAASAFGLALAAVFLREESRTPLTGGEGRRRRNLLRIAKVGPICVGPTTTVLEAIQTMSLERVGAVLVTDRQMLKGILTERDVMLRVVLEGKEPKKTRVGEVMTRSVTTIDSDSSPEQALMQMADERIRHLPVVGPSGKVEGMLSLRHLLGRKVENLESNLDSLAAYISADGIGG